MVGTLKQSVEILALRAQAEAEAEGWQCRKTWFRFSRELGPGITQDLFPRFTYLLQGNICLLQPYAPITSDLFKSVCAKVIGKGGRGPAQITLLGMKGSERGDLRSPGWKEKFDTRDFNVIEMEVPELTPAMGYYQVEELQQYLYELRTTLISVASKSFDLTSDSAFLRSLPTEFTVKNLDWNYYGDVCRSSVSFALVRLLCGERKIFERMRDTNIGLFKAYADKDLQTLEDMADTIEPLAT